MLVPMRVTLWLSLACLLNVAWTPAAPASDREARKQEIRQVAVQTLEQLYWLQPRARAALEAAEGYAVFSNFGMKLALAGGGSGHGIAIERESRRVTYMKVAEVQAGLGFGVRKYRQVWAFERLEDLTKFVDSGWELGGQSSASAQLGGRGAEVFSGAVSLRPGVWLYQLTDDGLVLDLTVKGARYYRDRKLN